MIAFLKAGKYISFSVLSSISDEELCSICSSDVRNKKIVFVVGFMKDKEYTEALSKLKDMKNDNISFVAVNVETNPRSENAENLKNAIESLGFRCETAKNVSEGVEYAKKKADIVFAIGSLYMYKEL